MNIDIILTELTFKAVRSSGPGGQHVNKTATKIEGSLSIRSSQAFSEKEREQLYSKLKSKISTDGVLQLSCGKTRSQYRNKTIVIERFLEILRKNLKKQTPRKKTKPSKGAIEKRLKAKKKKAFKKLNRKPPKIN